ncbi:hypothetical protein BBP40_009451 [Aspergillus hancockii]|nr:hypothetical protein BBP40_009451 [Aspergillus hancockii]
MLTFLRSINDSNWMSSMKMFAEFLKAAKPDPPVQPIKIAVIDDGIDTALDIFTNRILVGELFYQLSDVSGYRRAYYSPSAPRGCGAVYLRALAPSHLHATFLVIFSARSQGKLTLSIPLKHAIYQSPGDPQLAADQSTPQAGRRWNWITGHLLVLNKYVERLPPNANVALATEIAFEFPDTEIFLLDIWPVYQHLEAGQFYGTLLNMSVHQRLPRIIGPQGGFGPMSGLPM